MCRHMTTVGTDVSEEHISSISVSEDGCYRFLRNVGFLQEWHGDMSQKTTFFRVKQWKPQIIRNNGSISEVMSTKQSNNVFTYVTFAALYLADRNYNQ
jgi:hypothetical protein